MLRPYKTKFQKKPPASEGGRYNAKTPPDKNIYQPNQDQTLE